MTCRNLSFSIAVGALSLLPCMGAADEFKAQAFQDALTEALEDYPGVEFSTDGNMEAYLSSVSPVIPQGQIEWFSEAMNEWAAEAIRTAPEFGFVVYNPEGIAWDIIGKDVPHKISDDMIDISGYRLPAGYTVNTVGKLQYIDAVAQVAATRQVSAPSEDMERTVQLIKAAGDYIKQELCSFEARPTEITLNLTAGFKLVFGLETGSSFFWDLEAACNRQGDAE